LQLNPAKSLRKYVTAPFGKLLGHGAISADRKTLAVALNDTEVHLFDIETGKAGHVFKHDSGIGCLAFSADGKYLACGSNGWQYKDNKAVIVDGKRVPGDLGVRVWNVETGMLDHHYTDVNEEIRYVAFTGDGVFLLGSGFRDPLCVWDRKTHKAPDSFRAPALQGYQCLAPVGKSQVLLGSLQGTILLWDVDGSKLVRSFSGHSSFIHALAVVPGDKQFVSGAGFPPNRRTGRGPKDCTLRLWDIDKGIELGRSTFTGPVWGLTVSSDGAHALAADWRAVRLIDLKKLAKPDAVVVKPDDPVKPDTPVQPEKKPAEPFTGHKGTVSCIACSPDGKYLLTGGENSARLWDAKTGAEIHKFTVRDVGWVCFSGDGKRMLVLSGTANAHVYDTEKRTQVCFFGYSSTAGLVRGALNRVGDEIFVPSGRVLYTYVEAGQGRITTTRSVTKTLPISCFAYAADGSFYAYGDSTGAVRISNIGVKKDIINYTAHKTGPILCLVITGGKNPRVISGGGDKAIVVRNARNVLLGGKRLTGHQKEVTGLAVSADGKKLVSCSNDQTVRVWDLSSGVQLNKFTAEEAVSGVAFAPDGKSVVSCGEKGLRFWKLTAGK
jgi:WD40 repeat protein